MDLLIVTALFSPVHEGTLVQALSVMSLWCAKFSTEVPTKLVEWFKKGMGLKQSTSTVRNAYIQCMLAAFHGTVWYTLWIILCVFLTAMPTLAARLLSTSETP